MRTLEGAVAIVTGASSGIGAETARELARSGVRVVVAARREVELEQVSRQIEAGGGTSISVVTDVTNAEQARRLVERAIEKFGQVDILVNNAGIGARHAFAKSSEEEIAQIINVNLLGAMFVTRAALPWMLERRQGAIISVASVAGLIAVDPLYSATKFGLRGFSLSLRRQVAHSGVSVSLVSPGFIRTAVTEGVRGRLPGPEVVARAIAGLALKPRREVVVPGYYHAPMWVERFMPWAVDLAIGRRRSV